MSYTPDQLPASATVADVWEEMIGTLPVFPPTFLADVTALNASTPCGQDCIKAMEAVQRVMGELDPHPDVQKHLSMALAEHLSILING